MPALEFLTRPEVSPAPPPAGTVRPDPPSGSAPRDQQFGDVLSNSIDSTAADDKSKAAAPPAPTPRPDPKSPTSQAPAPQSTAPAATAADPKSTSESSAATDGPSGADEQTALAAELAAAASVQVVQSPTGSVSADDPAAPAGQARALPVPGAPPAQLASQLAGTDAPVDDAPPPAPAASASPDSGAAGATPPAPQALISSLLRAENQPAIPTTASIATAAPEAPAENVTLPTITTASTSTRTPAANQSPAQPQISGNAVLPATTPTSSQNSTAASLPSTPAPANANTATATEPPAPVAQTVGTVAGVTAPDSGSSANSDPGSNASSSFGSSSSGAGGSSSPAAAQSLFATVSAPSATVAAVVNSLPDAASAISGHSTTDAASPSAGGDSAATPAQAGAANPDLSILGSPPPSLQLPAAGLAVGQPPSTTEIHSGVVNQVVSAIQYTHPGGQGMQLHLTPPDLGSVQIDVSVRDGVLSARLEAQSPTTQQILTDNLSVLKESLSQQGVNFDRIDVRLAGSNTGTGGFGSADPSLAQQQQQQEGALPWEQQFNTPATDDAGVSPQPANVRNSRAPLTTLDIMV